MLDVAYINLAHYQRQADLIHSLHVASQPLLILEGWDDQTKDMAVGVNYAIATQPGNKVYYVEPASSAFEAQSNEIRELQQQMASLGIATLSQQKFVAESADARRLDKVDTNSMLAAGSSLNSAAASAAVCISVRIVIRYGKSTAKAPKPNSTGSSKVKRTLTEPR
jgi:hypothetical protein